jgi:cathepsin D
MPTTLLMMNNQLHAARLPVFTSALLAVLATAGCGGSTTSPSDNSGGGDSGSAPGLESGAVDSGHVDDDASAPESGTPTEAGPPPGVLAVPLSSCTSDVYSASISVGGTQTFQVIVDTGSSTLGIASSTCTTCNVTPEYSPGSTAVDQNMMTNIQYASGSWSGEVYQDQVAVGPSQAAPVKLAAIDTQTDFFEPMQCDSTSGSIQGIIGFGPPLAVAKGTNLWFNSWVTTSSLPDIFATELCETGGTLWLGGYDPSHTTAAPQYTPKAAELESYYHAVTLTSITVGTTTVPVASNSLPYTVMDTGTSVFLMDSTPYAALSAAIESNAMFSSIFGATFFPAASNNPQPNCSTSTQTKAALDAALPPLTLNFGASPGITVKALPTESYLLQAGGGWCTALVGYDFAGSGAPIASIMGAAALKSNVVIFDQVQNRIGFAPHAPCP